MPHGVFDMLLPPMQGHVLQRPSKRHSGSQTEGRETGGDVGGRASVVDELVSMGAQVFNCGAEGSPESLPWDHLRGVDEIKREVEDSVLLQLTHPSLYAHVLTGTRGPVGAHSIQPRAVLFQGPPGCGKTSMARMISSKAHVTMVYVPLEAVRWRFGMLGVGGWGWGVGWRGDDLGVCPCRWVQAVCGGLELLVLAPNA